MCIIESFRPVSLVKNLATWRSAGLARRSEYRRLGAVDSKKNEKTEIGRELCLTYATCGIWTSLGLLADRRMLDRLDGFARRLGLACGPEC